MLYPMSAMITIFYNLLQDPLGPRSAFDLKLILNVPSFLIKLESLLESERYLARTRLLQELCTELGVAAERAVQKALDRRHQGGEGGRSHISTPANGSMQA